MSRPRSKRSALLAVLIGVVAGCNERSIDEEPRDVETPCRIFCERWDECGREVVTLAFETAAECIEKCTANPNYQSDKACGDETYEYLRCTANPENACPHFAANWTTEDIYQGPCGPETKAVTDCHLEKF